VVRSRAPQHRRAGLLLALPIEKLERLALEARVRAIGRQA